MRNKRNAYKGLVGKIDKTDHLEEIGVDGNIILMRILKEREDVDWIKLTQNKDKRRTLINADINLCVS
jgi:hypothetical protein